jgi:hypothetical protein
MWGTVLYGPRDIRFEELSRHGRAPRHQDAAAAVTGRMLNVRMVE